MPLPTHMTVTHHSANISPLYHLTSSESPPPTQESALSIDYAPAPAPVHHGPVVPDPVLAPDSDPELVPNPTPIAVAAVAAAAGGDYDDPTAKTRSALSVPAATTAP